MASGLVKLTAGDLIAVVAPGIGASLARLTWRGKDLLRPSEKDAIASRDPFRLSCFPMAPWSNRIAPGGFRWEGRAVQLQPNVGASPHATDGQVWLRPWSLDRLASDRVALSCSGGGDAWPWRYRAEFDVRLGRHSAALQLSVMNTDSSPMAALIGLHPCFPPAHAQIRFGAKRVWRTQEGLAVEDASVPAEWSFEDYGPAPDVDLCFSGWTGRADIRWPRMKLRIEAESATFLHVFSSEDENVLRLGPQTGAPDAMHVGSSDGPSVLKPGESLRMSMTLTPGL